MHQSAGGGLRAVLLLQEGVHLAVPQRLGGQVGRPARGRHLPPQDLLCGRQVAVPSSAGGIVPSDVAEILKRAAVCRLSIDILSMGNMT